MTAIRRRKARSWWLTNRSTRKLRQEIKQVNCRRELEKSDKQVIRKKRLSNPTNPDVIPKTALLRGLLRCHGLSKINASLPIPEKQKEYLYVEAASLQRNFKRIHEYSVRLIIVSLPRGSRKRQSTA